MGPQMTGKKRSTITKRKAKKNEPRGAFLPTPTPGRIKQISQALLDIDGSTGAVSWSAVIPVGR